MTIPRVLHRIWLGPPMPPEFAAYGDRWAALHPDWTHCLWDERLADELAPPVRALYDDAAAWCPERYVPRFRSNLLRYHLLATRGGVYVDCDLAPLRPLDDLPGIDDVSAFAGWERQGEWIGNTILGAEAGSPLFAQLLAGAPASCARHRGKPSPYSTGPQYLTRAWRADPAGLTVYDEPIFYPRSWRDLERAVDPGRLADAFTDHKWCALRGQVSVVVPYRGDGAERDRHLDLIRSHYAFAHPDYQFVVSLDDGRDGEHFNKGRLATAGVEASMGDVVVVTDGDLWVDPERLRAAVAAVRDHGGWVIPYDQVRRLTPEATERVYAGEEPDLSWPLDRPAYAGVPGGGCWVVRREDYLRVGGMDPRFAGWGGEDDVWGWWADQFIRRHRRLPGPLWHLWHPQAPNLRLNVALWRAYQAARHNPAALRALRPGADGSGRSPARRPAPPRPGRSPRPVLVGRPGSLTSLGRPQ